MALASLKLKIFIPKRIQTLNRCRTTIRYRGASTYMRRRFRIFCNKQLSFRFYSSNQTPKESTNVQEEEINTQLTSQKALSEVYKLSIKLQNQMKTFLETYSSELEELDEGRAVENANIPKVGKHILATLNVPKYSEAKNLVNKNETVELLYGGLKAYFNSSPASVDLLWNNVEILTTSNPKLSIEDEETLLLSFSLTMDELQKTGFLEENFEIKTDDNFLRDFKSLNSESIIRETLNRDIMINIASAKQRKSSLILNEFNELIEISSELDPFLYILVDYFGGIEVLYGKATYNKILMYNHLLIAKVEMLFRELSKVDESKMDEVSFIHYLHGFMTKVNQDYGFILGSDFNKYIDELHSFLLGKEIIKEESLKKIDIDKEDLNVYIQEALDKVSNQLLKESGRIQMDRSLLDFLIHKLNERIKKEGGKEVNEHLLKNVNKFYLKYLGKYIYKPVYYDVDKGDIKDEISFIQVHDIPGSMTEAEREQYRFKRLTNFQYSDEILERRKSMVDIKIPDIVDTLPDYSNIKIDEYDRPFGRYLSSSRTSAEIFRERNVNNFISFFQRDYDRYFPEGIGGEVKKEFEFTGSKTLLLRKPVFDSIKNIELALEQSFSKSHSPPPILLHGHKGCGKSAVLSLVVYWARRNDWLVVYIPNGYEWANGGRYIVKNQELGTWDQPFLAKQFFNTFVQAHQDKLSQIKLKTKFIAGRHEATTLLDLCEIGSLFEQHSAKAFIHFRNELTKITDYPVLIAIDNYNSFFGESVGFKDPESQAYVKKQLKTDQLTMVKAFKDAHLNPNLSYGTFIGALSRSKSYKNFNYEMLDESERESNTWIEVPPYSRIEHSSIMKHYIKTLAVKSAVGTHSNTEEYVYQLTSGFGSEVLRYSERI